MAHENWQLKIYTTKAFARFSRKQTLSDAELTHAIERAASGLVDGDLGGGIVKQRIAREGQGRRGGYRALIAIAYGRRAVFLHGFAKKDRENIEEHELAALRENAKVFLRLNDAGIRMALDDGLLNEVHDDHENHN